MAGPQKTKCRITIGSVLGRHSKEMKAEIPAVIWTPMFIEALQWPKGGYNPSTHHWMDGQAKRDVYGRWNSIWPKKEANSEANSDTCCTKDQPC